MQYTLDLTSEELPNGPIDPRTVKSVDFEMTVAGDYNIVVIGFSEANRSDDPLAAEWIKTEDGHIESPYRDVLQAPGNYGRSDHYTQNRSSLRNRPSSWEDEGAPRTIRYRYGAARAGVLYGIDLEGTLLIPLSERTIQLTESLSSIQPFRETRSGSVDSILKLKVLTLP